jgi:hypothetical protein
LSLRGARAHASGVAFYLRCRVCRGIGLWRGALCPACKGWGGYWVYIGPGISIRLVPGDADTKPEEPP